MNYQKQYANKIGWKNSPDTSTPINATNLNKVDNALWYMDNALYVLSRVIAGGSSAKGGIITNVGSNTFTTHLEMRSGEDLSTGELLLLRSNVSGSGNGINVYIDESMAVGFGFVDLSGTATSVTLTNTSVLLLMLDAEENTAQVLSVLGEGGGGGGLPETPLAIIHGGTGNTVGYIQTGRAGNTTIGLRATAEGGENESSGEASHAEGSYNVASANNSHAEGYGTTASDLFAHAEGYNTTASEDATHAEGSGTTASELYAHAEGHSTTASGESSHAEGLSTTASSTGAHAEGVSTTASGSYSHAGGATSVASGNWSFAHGVKVTASYNAQSAFGNRNNNKSNTLFEVGNGRWDANTGNDVYSNAFEVYNDGKASWDNGSTKFQFTAQNGEKGYIDESGTFNAFGGGTTGDVYAGLGEGKMVSFTNNVIDTDIDLHRAPMAGDRLLIWFDTTVQNPTGLTTYNNGTAVTSNLESVTPLLYNAGWNLVEYMNDGLLYNNVWVRKQNVPIPNNTLSGLSDTAISVNPTDGQVLTFDSVTGKWGNQNPSGGVAESVVGPVENSTTASKAYAVGEHFIRNDKFCTAIAAIASGATLTLNTNYVEGTIAECINYHVYSATERVVGKWVDGKDIFEKTYDFGAIGKNSYYDVLISNLDTVIQVYGISGEGTPVPYLDTAGASGFVGWYKFAGGVCIITGSNRQVSAGKVTIQYTKSSS